jgi:hypothetical protein
MEAIHERMESLESRMESIQRALNKILGVFGMELEPIEPKSSIYTAPSRNESWNLVTATEATSEEPEEPFSMSLGNIFEDNESIASVDVKEGDGNYHYSSLDVTKNEIRVLALHHADNFTDPIIAELKNHSLDDESYTTMYQALSYTWGPPVFDGSIQLNGCAFPVTENLETALRFMRGKRQGPYGAVWPASAGPTLWWIDQICINQSDVDERNHQISLMRRIYKLASAVSVWLGEEAEDSSTAMELLNKLGAPPVNAPGEKTINYPSFTEDDVHRHWKALDALFKRPWFQRAWIRQEVVLSNFVIFNCGEKSLPMEALGPALTALRYAQGLGYNAPISHGSSTESTVNLPWTHHANQLVELRSNTNGGYSWVDLHRILPSSRASKATDPRDTVFSLLGLADPDLFSVPVDYRHEVKDVLIAATATVITKPFGLDILGACQNPDRANSLPSWVPNLVEPWKAMPFRTWKPGSPVHESDMMVTEHEEADVKVEGECLIVRGGHVDSIALLSDHVVNNNSSAEHLDEVYNAWKVFSADAWKRKQMEDWEAEQYLKCNHDERMRNWIKFLSALTDDAGDFGSNYRSSRTKGNGTGKNTKMSEAEMLQIAQEELDQTHGFHNLNLKLTRAYLLPSIPTSYRIFLHSNRRLHAALRTYAINRRFCITKRGFLALVPAEAEIGNSLALFKGASVPYVLRRHEQKTYVLVGEALVPRYSRGRGEDLVKEEFAVRLNTNIRIC